MKRYMANGEGKFIIDKKAGGESGEAVKVRVTKVIPTRSDLDIFLGKADIKYPFMPCHMAVGLISEDRQEFGLKRGNKVILNPYVVMHADKDEVCPETKIYGADMDGFLADFIDMPPEIIVVFPEEVKEEEAVFTEYIAMSLSAINCFKIEKGDYIAIIGGSPLCNITAQLSLYFQAIPIVIDHSADRLAKARECGVYYTVNTAKESPQERVLEITGGRMADHTILESEAGAVPHYLFTLTKNGGDCVIMSVHSYPNALEADINLINRKQLEVRGVSNGAHEFNSAVYILAQKILKLAPLIEKSHKAENLEEVFTALSQRSYGMANIIEI